MNLALVQYLSSYDVCDNFVRLCRWLCRACALCARSDVRVDAKLNKFLFSKGVRNVPSRVRVRLSRKRNEDEEATEKVIERVVFLVVRVYTGARACP